MKDSGILVFQLIMVFLTGLLSGMMAILLGYIFCCTPARDPFPYQFTRHPFLPTNDVTQYKLRGNTRRLMDLPDDPTESRQNSAGQSRINTLLRTTSHAPQRAQSFTAPNPYQQSHFQYAQQAFMFPSQQIIPPQLQYQQQPVMFNQYEPAVSPSTFSLHPTVSVSSPVRQKYNRGSAHKHMSRQGW